MDGWMCGMEQRTDSGGSGGSGVVGFMDEGMGGARVEYLELSKLK